MVESWVGHMWHRAHRQDSAVEQRQETCCGLALWVLEGQSSPGGMPVSTAWAPGKVQGSHRNL